ncbi:hypothetical protein E8E14_007539 [Neopestalotiopsis sp. 37M]|nr:hypothetical protein E8E14_007539 [Neopestalotiopsis sp. 37M]
MAERNMAEILGSPKRFKVIRNLPTSGTQDYKDSIEPDCPHYFYLRQSGHVQIACISKSSNTNRISIARTEEASAPASVAVVRAGPV